MGKVLLYNVNLMKADSIIKVASGLGHQVVVVPQSQFGTPVGAVSMGVMGASDKGITIDGEMMVMAGFFGDSLDKFIDAYNAAGVSKIECKAVLTPVNSKLNARQLYKELEEHSKNMK